jgi:hypothetical protein
MPDRQIARLLRRSGKTTDHANDRTEQRVRGLREHHDIASYCDGEWAERGEIALDVSRANALPLPRGHRRHQRATRCRWRDG